MKTVMQRHLSFQSYKNFFSHPTLSALDWQSQRVYSRVGKGASNHSPLDSNPSSFPPLLPRLAKCQGIRHVPRGALRAAAKSSLKQTRLLLLTQFQWKKGAVVPQG
jgi:hypothetical protein